MEHTIYGVGKAYNFGNVEKSHQRRSLAILPCSRIGCTLRASKGLRPAGRTFLNIPSS